MKQVTYTHLDGTVSVFTANTAITQMLWSKDKVDPFQTPVTRYITDWGFSTWAQERLSSDEFAKFEAARTEWQSHNDPEIPKSNLDSFKNYWTMFYMDPNVIIEE